MRELDILMLVLSATAVAGIARWRGLPPAVVLVVVGLAVSYLPGVPNFELDPEVALLFLLPPLLYSAALESSYLGFRANIRPITLLSVGYVLFAAVVVGLVAYVLVPELPLAAALAFGALVAPPDAVAATAIARRVGLPRRVVTILAGESLLNDATALTAYRVAVAAAVGGGFSLLETTGRFAYAAAGGLAVGFVLAPVTHWVRIRLRDSALETTVELLVPFFGYVLAEQLGGSGVLAVVVIGLYLGHRANETSYAARLQARSVWKTVTFLLESVVFALIGLQVRVILGALSDRPWSSLVWYGTVLLGVVVLARFAWVFPATYLTRLVPRISERDPAPPWQYPAVISWAGMRGVVSLAAAFALPLETDAGSSFPARDLVLFLTFVIVIGTLVIQGLTLPYVVSRLGIGGGRQSYDDALAEAAAKQDARREALLRLDRALAEDGAEPPDGVAERLRALVQERSNAAWERLGAAPESDETPAEAFRRLRQEMLEAERDVFIRLRNERRIDDEVLRRLLYELDLEEAMLAQA